MCIRDREITKLRQKQAEYLALQNQINPHFLYNALEAIRTDALLADCEDIAETTEALATFFRYTISNVKEYVTFSDELDNAENYFTIQRCRFGDKISMELELENEQLLDCLLYTSLRWPRRAALLLSMFPSPLSLRRPWSAG